MLANSMLETAYFPDEEFTQLENIRNSQYGLFEYLIQKKLQNKQTLVGCLPIAKNLLITYFLLGS